jgi:hypothetical protein
MKIIKLYTGKDNKSYFEEIAIPLAQRQELGLYSAKVAVENLYFRETTPNAVFEWHNAPCAQYIIYLEGKVEVLASGGETRHFGPGDILLATDLEGQGHVSKVINPGKSIVVTLSP